MKLLNVMKYTILGSLRDPKTWISYILFPVILIMVLGNALSSAFEANTIPEFQVGFLNEDAGDAGAQLAEYLENQTDSVMKIQYAGSRTEAETAVREGTYDVVVHVPKDYSRNLSQDLETKVFILGKDAGSIRANVVTQYVDGYLNAVNAMYAAAFLELPAQEYVQLETIEDRSFTLDGNVPEAIDFYAVAMLVMTLMYGAAVTAREYEVNLRGASGNRLRLAPVRFSVLLFGKLVSCMIITTIQSTLILIISAAVFQADWGNHIPLVILIIILGSAVGNIIGLFACLLVNDGEKVGGVISVLIPLMTFLSGGFTGSSFGWAANISPNYHLQNALTSVIFSDNPDHVIKPVLILCTIAAISAIGSVLLSERPRKC